MLLDQSQKNDILIERLKETQAKLDDKMLTISKAGSLADATVWLHGLFEAAQRTADAYLENVRAMEARLTEANRRVEREEAIFGRLREKLAGYPELQALLELLDGDPDAELPEEEPEDTSEDAPEDTAGIEDETEEPDEVPDEEQDVETEQHGGQ